MENNKSMEVFAKAPIRKAVLQKRTARNGGNAHGADLQSGGHVLYRADP